MFFNQFMRYRLYIRFFAVFLMAFVGMSKAQTAKYSNEFLNIGVDARALGMANSVVANVSDVTSGYWNPTGLLNVKDKGELAVMHADYFASIAKYDYMAGAMPIDSVSAVGVSLIRFGVDDIMNTTELIDKDGNIDYDRISLFSAADYALLLSYARKSKIPGLDYGGNAKIIYRRIGDFASSWGFGFDVAVRYQRNNWRFAAVARDITTTFNAWSFDEEFFDDDFQSLGQEPPENGLEITIPRLLLGVARDFRINDKFGLLAELDADFLFDGERNALISGETITIEPHVGLELNYNKWAFLRMGVGNLQREQDFGEESVTFQPNLGFGFVYKDISLDYALTDIGDQSTALYSNVFSLKYHLK